MSVDPVLALLQVSTALGVLYLALPEARYRDKLFQQIVEAFKDQEVEEVGDEDAETSPPCWFVGLFLWWPPCPSVVASQSG